MQLRCAGQELGDQLADRGQAGAQLGVADLDRHHRVLQVGEDLVGVLDRLGRALEEAAHALRRQAGRGGLEGAAGQADALGEAGVHAPGAAVGELGRPEELLLEPVGGVGVELLVGGAERRERDAELVGRLGDPVEQVAAGVAGLVRHRPQRNDR